MTFRYGNPRDLGAAGKPQPAELTLSGDEFLHRWSDHVPLPGVPRVRAWGVYASTQRPKLTRCREELPEKDTIREKPQAAEARSPDNRPWERCPVCHHAMVVTQVLPRAGAPPGTVLARGGLRGEFNSP